MAEAEIKGLAELEKFMQDLPLKVEKNVMRSSMRAGAKVLMVQAKAKLKSDSGDLRDSMRIGTDAKGGRVTAYVRAGGKNKKTGKHISYAHIIEWGAKAHAISARKSGGFLNIGKLFARSVWHPGIKPNPFMRPTLDTYWQQALEVTAKKMRATLEKKHGLTAPAPKEEGDV